MIRFGIVGCGHIAAKHVAALKMIQGAELVAVCDTNERRLKEFLVDGVQGVSNIKDLLQLDIDVVCICTPSGLHKELTLQAARGGKHVVVEKPMALTLSDASEMITVCNDNNVKLAVVHPNRFRPAVQLLHHQVSKEAFGRIGHANCTVRWNRDANYYKQASWRGTLSMDGGVLLNQAIHNIDLLLWLLGEVEEVSAYTATRMREIEAEDTAIAVLRFKSGVLGVVEACVTVYPKNLEESIAVFGEKGTAIIGGTTANWIKRWDFFNMTEEEAGLHVQRVEQDPYGTPGHVEILRDMVDAIQENREPVISGIQGREALALVLACQRSSQLNEAVQMSDMREWF